MTLEDIKSPLPARKVLIADENESVNPQPTVTPRTDVITPPTATNVKVKKSIKKPLIFILVAIILLVLGIIIFNLLKGNGTARIVNLTYWGLWEDESMMNGIIADFETKNPNIKITYKKNQQDGYRGRLTGRLDKTGTVEDVPDIYRIHNTWIPMFRDYLAVVPSTTVDTIGLETDFFNVYKSDLKENNQWLSVPLMYDGLVMFYNPDLLNKAGVEVPKDWWSLKKAAVKITQRDENEKIKVAGASIGLTDNVDQWSDIIGLMIKQNGVNTRSIGSTENVTKLKDVFSFYTLFKTSDKVWDETLPNSTQFFASGNLGFYFGSSWRIFDIQALNPNLKFEVTGMPQLPTTTSTQEINPGAELTNIYWSSYWTEGVNNKSENQKEAWKFLEYLSSAEVLEKMYQADSQIRSFGQIYPRKSMANKISSNPLIKPFVETANNAASWYLASNTKDDGVNTQMEKYFSDGIGSILKSSSNADDAVGTVVKGILQLQQRYGLIK